MFEWILALLIFLCCLVGFNVYLNLKNTNDDNIEEEEILSEITEELLQQKHFQHTASHLS